MPESRRSRRKRSRPNARYESTPVNDAATTSPKRIALSRTMVSFVVAGLVLVSAVTIGWWAWSTANTESSDSAGLASASRPSSAPSRDPGEPLTIEGIQRGPHLVFQNVIRDDAYGQASLLPLDSPGGMRLSTGLVCERIHFAGGRGICLAADVGTQSQYVALPFDADFVPLSRVPIDGAPSFARVSPDGSLAAASVQTTPPTEEMPFAPSRTLIIETSTGRVVANLNDFSLTRDGVAVAETERDFWGVTFKADSDGFFASVRVAGNIYLVEGSVDARAMVVLQPGVSAPSVSPDGTRLAYAKLISNIGPTWRFHVLDLATQVDLELSETKSVDDQMEWLDNQHLLYGLGADIWSLASDGTGLPAPFLFGGLSPSVVRPL